MFVGCNLSDALVEGSDGLCTVEPIHLDSESNDELSFFCRAIVTYFLLCIKRSYSCVMRLAMSDSSSADSVSDVVRLVLLMASMHAALHNTIYLCCIAVWVQQLPSPRSCNCHCCISWFDRRKYGTCSYFSRVCEVILPPFDLFALTTTPQLLHAQAQCSQI